MADTEMEGRQQEMGEQEHHPEADEERHYPDTEKEHHPEVEEEYPRADEETHPGEDEGEHYPDTGKEHHPEVEEAEEHPRADEEEHSGDDEGEVAHPAGEDEGEHHPDTTEEEHHQEMGEEEQLGMDKGHHTGVEEEHPEMDEDGHGEKEDNQELNASGISQEYDEDDQQETDLSRSLDESEKAIEGGEIAEGDDDEEEYRPRALESPTDDLEQTGDDHQEEEHGEGEASHHQRTIESLSGEEENKEEEEEGEDTVRHPEEVSQLMQNIFGDDDVSDDDEEGPSNRKNQYEDEDEPKLIRIEQEEEDVEQDSLGRKWDFDVMLAKKKQERKRRRRKDGSIDLMADADDQIRALVDAMNEAANDDRVSNMDRRPAVKKRKMLSMVKDTLLKADLFEAMLDNGMISALSEWLAPLPDKSLPALEIRCTLLKILEGWPNLEQSILKQSGLGRAVMYLFKHPKETKENKLIAAKLIREWSRPIFQLDSDFRSLSKEERVQRDFSQMPLAKRRRLSMDDDGIPLFSNKQRQARQDEEGASGTAPGEAGFIPRARVPKPSTRDYVIRPKPEIEGQFRGETKSKQTSRFAKVQRQFRNQKVTRRAVGVSINKAIV